MFVYKITTCTFNIDFKFMHLHETYMHTFLALPPFSLNDSHIEDMPDDPDLFFRNYRYIGFSLHVLP
jgi:hypothetical protein